MTGLLILSAFAGSQSDTLRAFAAGDTQRAASDRSAALYRNRVPLRIRESAVKPGGPPRGIPPSIRALDRQVEASDVRNLEQMRELVELFRKHNLGQDKIDEVNRLIERSEARSARLRAMREKSERSEGPGKN